METRRKKSAASTLQTLQDSNNKEGVSDGFNWGRMPRLHRTAF